MFAFAVWDMKEHTLYLVRDRLGIKPLYYGWTSDGTFLFASELKAIVTWNKFDNSVDLKALGLFFRHNYIPAPYTIYQDIFKLTPGTILELHCKQISDKNVEIKPYWSIKEIWEQGIKEPLNMSDKEAVMTLEDTLIDAVKMRMISDVPLGAFLSGGIDSSTVVALMQAVSSRPVRTFSIGFPEREYNEAPMAKDVASYLGTEHTELYVTSSDALNIVPDIPLIWDEPFADSSQIPTYLVSKLARQHVTVSLSGDGGDELFSGYPRYFETLRLWKMRNRLPSPLRKVMLHILWTCPNMFLDFTWSLATLLLKRHKTHGSFSRISKRICEMLTADNLPEFYGVSNSHLLPFGEIVPGHDNIASIFHEETKSENKNSWAVMSLLDIMTYLVDDILVKVDRASMAVSLEARVPLLDHRVVELAAKIPTDMKVREDGGKWILRQVLYNYIPREMVDRPKMGFGIPLGQWLRDDLREWVEELLDTDRIKREGYLNTKTVSMIWQEHRNKTANYQYVLWNILMFQAWLEKWG
jgi:asparagine synthase (glutamine-hydrolysing)